MKRGFQWGCLGLLVVMSGCMGGGGESGPAQAAAGTKIGTYDSRSVAVAFAGSPRHEEQIARAAGDSAEPAAAEAGVLELQKRLHRQGFGTAPVDEILALYPEATSTLVERHGLAALVSVWDEDALRAHPGAERIDVTEELVDLMAPVERQRRSALEIRKSSPLSEAQLERMMRQGH